MGFIKNTSGKMILPLGARPEDQSGPVRRRRTDDAQVEKFHHEMMELIKKYQFRDRNQTSCCSLSVSILTRVVDHVVVKKLVSRQEDTRDRRFRSIQLTEQGEAVFEQFWKGVSASEKAILGAFPPSRRSRSSSFCAC